MIPNITVLVSTSPRPSHPSTRILEQTVNSVRMQLSDSPIIISFDGTTNAIPSYEAFKVAINGVADSSGWKSLHEFFVYPEHQSGMLAGALEDTKTALILYLEDDWQLLPDIPWLELSDLIMSGGFNYIKLHAAPRISPYHEHLMLERTIYQNGVGSPRYDDARGGKAIPIISTRQWSQNPHLASTDFYRRKILPLCEGKTDFIENICHGIVANSPWNEYRCGIYNPAERDMFRVRHLDGKSL